MYGTRDHGRAGRGIEEAASPMRWAEPDRDDAFDLREVVVEHRADIFRYARSFCRNDADAEDLAQNAVLRALAAGAEVRNPERAKWYLLRIVRNLATDQARARARMAVEPWAVGPDAASDDPAPDARLLHDDEHELPRAAFADLPRVHQEVLHLRFVEELDHAAIAARLHTTEQAARQRVYRAMQALRAITQQRQLGLDNP
jgi:RNA polymerase sigma factor (sigma-70 family)